MYKGIYKHISKQDVRILRIEIKINSVKRAVKKPVMTIPTRNIPVRTLLHLGSSFMKAFVALSSNTKSSFWSFLDDTPQISFTQRLHMDIRSAEGFEFSEMSTLEAKKCSHTFRFLQNTDLNPDLWPTLTLTILCLGELKFRSS